jgi:hypothetical protein
MAVTVLVLLGSTLWLTRFETISVTITKPDNTDPPFLIRENVPFELEGIADDGDNLYQQPEMVQMKCFSKDPQASGGEQVHWEIHSSVDPVTKRFGQRVWPIRRVPHERAYITIWRVRVRSGRWLNPPHRLLTTNIVKVRVE